ncbi:MAG: type II toxin-antitoxin system YafQ family toxin [Cytophagales bacterium]|nr:type II toxin-antitoxin system YafQ family toxin [Cytophagales bacterium]
MTGTKANPPLDSSCSKQFLKDWENLLHSGRYDMQKLKSVMLLLIANDAPLPPQYKDHQLIGDWKDHRECHIGGDFLLIYFLGKRSIIFARAGTHSELFS